MINPSPIFAFDLFGTLLNVKSRKDPYLKMVKHLQERYSLDRSQVLSLMRTPLDLEQAWVLLAPDEPIDQPLISELKNDLHLELESITVFDDAKKALALLQEAHIPFTYCSNLALPYVKGLDLLPQPSVPAILSFEVGYIKPDPMIFSLLLTRLNCSAPDVLFIGDRLEDDMEGAQRAGIRSSLIDRSNRHASYLGPKDNSLVSMVENELHRLRSSDLNVHYTHKR